MVMVSRLVIGLMLRITVVLLVGLLKLGNRVRFITLVVGMKRLILMRLRFLVLLLIRSSCVLMVVVTVSRLFLLRTAWVTTVVMLLTLCVRSVSRVGSWWKFLRLVLVRLRVGIRIIRIGRLMQLVAFIVSGRASSMYELDFLFWC